MEREQRTEVLVVGAGPVGMLTALFLREQDIRVRLIDQEWRTASRTYACALHPRTLKLLDQLGLAQDAIALGRRIRSVAFYEGEDRRAEVQLAPLSNEFPFVLVLPQSAFESLLESRLNEKQVKVEWSHRLSNLRVEGSTAVANVDRLGVSAKGYIVPEMDWSVQKSEPVRASFVVGADGPKSYVARTMDLASEAAGSPEFFAVFELRSDFDPGDELRVAIHNETTNVLWPLPEGKLRWSFQLLKEHLDEFPAKERSSLILGDLRQDAANRDFVLKLIRERAPWFRGGLDEIGWSTDVEFHRGVAKRYGTQQVWLVGDAAHQTGPGGMQSMNVGLLEAEELANALAKILKEHGSPTLLETYEQHGRDRWRTLLGGAGPLPAGPKADPWAKLNGSRILSCLPSTGEDLARLLGQLGLGLR